MMKVLSMSPRNQVWARTSISITSKPTLLRSIRREVLIMTQDRNYQLFFTQPGVAKLETNDIPTPGPSQLLIRTRASLISPGTERAFFLSLPNTTQNYPFAAGYCNVG